MLCAVAWLKNCIQLQCCSVVEPLRVLAAGSSWPIEACAALLSWLHQLILFGMSFAY